MQTIEGSSQQVGFEDVALGVREIIARHASRSVDEVPLETKLESQLEIDSMGMIQVHVSLEERFRVAMPDMAIDAMPSTVGDLARWIHGQIAAGCEVRP